MLICRRHRVPGQRDGRCQCPSVDERVYDCADDRALSGDGSLRGIVNIVDDKPDYATRGSIQWSEELARNLPDGRSATPPTYVEGAPASPVTRSYDQLVAAVSRQAAEIQQKITDLPPALGNSQETANLHTELASFREQLDSLISAMDRSSRRYFLLGLACAVPVGLLGSFLAFLIGWS